MKLYEISQQIRDILELGEYIDTDTGEYKTLDDLDALNLALDEKLESTCIVIKELRAMSDALKAEVDRLNARRQSIDNRINWLTGYIIRNGAGIEIDTPKAQLKWRKSEQVEIIGQVPEKYIIIKRQEDKVALKKVLKIQPVEGAILITKQNPQIK